MNPRAQLGLVLEEWGNKLLVVDGVLESKQACGSG